MRRILAIILVVTLAVVGCSSNRITDGAKENDLVNTSTPTLAPTEIQKNNPQTPEIKPAAEMVDIARPRSLNDIEEWVYANLAEELKSDDYTIEDIKAIYISQEYIDEVAYNSQSNIWFGYTLEEINQVYEGKPYVFTLSDEGETIVTAFQDYDDTYDQIVKNVAIGGGVILICVTVSYVATTVGAPAAVLAIISGAAKGSISLGTSFALSGGIISAAIEGIRAKDINSALKAGALGASKGLKYGAIIGAVTGGISGYSNFLKNGSEINNLGNSNPAARGRQAELRAQQQYGGEAQKTFLNGKEVPYGTPGATRPDLLRTLPNGKLEALEVKSYDLNNSANVNSMMSELKRQIAERVQNLPPDTGQRIVLHDWGFDETTVSNVVGRIYQEVGPLCKNLIVDIMR